MKINTLTDDQREIIAIGRKFNRNTEALGAIENGTSPEDFRSLVMASQGSRAAEEMGAPVAIGDFRTPGDFFVQNAEYRAATTRGTKSKHLRAEIDIPMGFNRATGLTTGLTSIDKQPGIVQLGVQPPHVADLITNLPAGGTTIRYIQETALNNAATPVAEEGQYPEATWNLAEVDAGVRKIAVIGRVSDEFFADYDATRDYINTRLAYMVAMKEDTELLNGVASATRIGGLLTFGIQTHEQGTSTVIDAIFKAITKIRTIGFFEPDGIVMHPNDLEGLRLMKDKNDQYYFDGPFKGSYGQPGSPGGFQLYIWGLPVVWTTSIAAGTMLVGAFKQGAGIFRKLGLTIETTNSDASDFQYGRIAIRATTRLALACYRPLAFCTVTGANGGQFA